VVVEHRLLILILAEPSALRLTYYAVATWLPVDSVEHDKSFSEGGMPSAVGEQHAWVSDPLSKMIARSVPRNANESGIKRRACKHTARYSRPFTRYIPRRSAIAVR
jgi:hypothetical protein